MNLTAETKKLKMSHHGNKSFQTQLSKDDEKIECLLYVLLKLLSDTTFSREKCTTMSNKKRR